MLIPLQPTAHAVTMSAMPPEDPTVAPEEEEVVDGLPVLAEVWPLPPSAEPGWTRPERAAPAEPPAPAVLAPAQAVAAVATGFVAGAATLALARRISRRRLARARPRRTRDAEGLSIVASRSFLVDVHLIRAPQE